MQPRFRRNRVCALVRIALASLVAGAPAVEAYTIDTGNDDLQATVGLTVRYNLGMRLDNRDPLIAGDPATQSPGVLAASLNTDDGTFSYNKNNVVTNRVDLLAEIEVAWRRMLGFRVSGSGWKDFAFHNDVRFNTAVPGNISSYDNNEFSSTTKRWNDQGSQFLDAYVFGNFDVGGHLLNVKAGRVATLWGETIALSTHSISANQAPSDIGKSFAVPGADAKETALPVGQLLATLQVLPELSVSAQWFYEWLPSRLPQGGTYLGPADFWLDGPTNFGGSTALKNLRNHGIIDVQDSHSEWGANARWTPEWLDGTLGVYARNFHDRLPTASITPATASYQSIYAENIKLYGVSLAKIIGGVSTGLELSYRPNAALNTPQLVGTADSSKIPRGRVFSALANATVQFGVTPVWDQAIVLLEVAYTNLGSVTDNAANYNAACKALPADLQTVDRGCLTSYNIQAMASFRPQWIGVVPGLDVGAAGTVVWGVKGNSPLLFGGNEGAGQYTVGISALYDQKHDFSLAYNDYFGSLQVLPNGAGVPTRYGNGLQANIKDRGWLSFTYKYSF